MFQRTWRQHLTAAALIALAYGLGGQVLLKGESLAFGLTYSAALFIVLLAVIALTLGLVAALRAAGVYRPRPPSDHYDAGE